ncbi:MAG: tRNA-uridine aminocarboxypropyltransferase [Sandaracinaceae bacterium]
MNEPSSESCETCRRPRAVCVCDRVVPFETTRRVLILQHPQEQDVLLGTSQLLAASLPQASVTIGLSWPNLKHALGDDTIDPQRWALLFPDRETEGPSCKSARGADVSPRTLEGLVVLDGTWSQAKTLYWRNAWLKKLARLSLAPKEPSIYGRLRAEPRKDFVSTLEAVGAALSACGEDPEIEAGLRRVFRTLVQRARDTSLPAEARRLPKRGRPKREPR